MTEEVIYSAQRDGFEPGLVYRNPRYFKAPLGRPDRVVVVGHWPEVAAAYRALGAEIVQIDVGDLRRALVQIPPMPESLGKALGGGPLDHDNDGRKGGSIAPPKTEDLAALRDEYTAKLGKRPFNGWDADTLRAKIEAANGQ